MEKDLLYQVVLPEEDITEVYDDQYDAVDAAMVIAEDYPGEMVAVLFGEQEIFSTYFEPGEGPVITKHLAGTTLKVAIAEFEEILSEYNSIKSDLKGVVSMMEHDAPLPEDQDGLAAFIQDVILELKLVTADLAELRRQLTLE